MKHIVRKGLSYNVIYSCSRAFSDKFRHLELVAIDIVSAVGPVIAAVVLCFCSISTIHILARSPYMNAGRYAYDLCDCL